MGPTPAAASAEGGGYVGVACAVAAPVGLAVGVGDVLGEAEGDGAATVGAAVGDPIAVGVDVGVMVPPTHDVRIRIVRRAGRAPLNSAMGSGR